MRANLTQVIAFAHVVREGSFTDAAMRLGVSQSAVSQQVARLESQVGAPLLIREREGLRLTPAGQEIYSLANRQADLEQLISERLADYAVLARGHLKIIANAPMPALDLISRFARLFPGVDLDFAICDWTSSVELLRSRKVDIAVLTAATPSRDWAVQPLGTTRYVLYAPKCHPFASRDRLALSDLADQTLLLPETGSLTQRVVASAYKKAGLTMPRVIRTTTFPLMKEAILQQVGIGLFLDNCTADSDRLITCRVDELCETYDISLVVPKDKQDLALIRRFRDLAEDHPPSS